MTYLYSWGANSHGQLGLGFVAEQILTPTRVEEVPDNLNESLIKLICGGGAHSFVLTSQGNLYGTGMNTYGQVGNGTQVKSVPCFQQIRGLEGQHIIEVVCGWSHSVALNDQGQVLVWGSNSHSQLGLPTEEVPFSCLPICLDLKDVVSIAAGLRHTVVATKDGSVYTWGQGHRGQLGHIDDNGDMVKRQFFPKVITMEPAVKRVACGERTTYALTTDGDILAWGDNKWGQLAHNPENLNFFSFPLQIPENFFGGEKIEWIDVGWTHCIAKSFSGEVYVWGRSDYGQIGSLDMAEQTIDPISVKSNPIRFSFVPSCLPLEKQVVSVHCGSEHNVARIMNSEDKSSIYTWGWNEHGNCGDGSTHNIYKPHKLSFPGNVTVIGVGAGHSFALVKNI